MSDEKQKEKICRLGQIAHVLSILVSDRYSLTIENTCIKSNCAHWIQTYPKIKREDHSGGKEIIFEYGIKTNRTPYREGPNGSTGCWTLDESGYCGFNHQIKGD
jgi:hypothetical protein